ncbi:MAG: glycosyltransferase [Candidatus Hodarchaeales archaeon]
MEFFLLILISINLISGLVLIPYPINLLLLAISSRNWADSIPRKHFSDGELPEVTIQVPIYNEANIVEETLKNLARILYPHGKLKIQIIDDSDDNTSSIIDSATESLRDKGIKINVIRRPERIGFKAGALSYGLKRATSDYIAIFDADFEINPNFLNDTIHLFCENEKLAAVQTRWDHKNLHFSLFTKAMSIGLDGHFLVEKMGRKRRNAFISFNGTGGVWRKKAIIDSGGWAYDTLAEDLDLAYRAQMHGYEILYLNNKTNKQEIPPTLRCWIIQQSRWSKGFSQNIRKNLLQFLRNPAGKSRIQGFIHLTQYFIPLMIIVNTSSGTLLLFFSNELNQLFFSFGILFSIASLMGIMAYATAILRANRDFYYILLIPLFLFWGAGLIVRMGVGTVTGLFTKGGVFQRTPKFNLSDSRNKKTNLRVLIPLDRVFLIEMCYILLLTVGAFRAMSLGAFYITQGFYYLFILVSLLNMVSSELIHAFLFEKKSLS